MKPFSAILIFLVLCGGCINHSPEVVTDIPVIKAAPMINYAVTKYFPHDKSLFTEGLLFYNGQLFESTGNADELPDNNSSVVGITDLKTGTFSKKISIDKKKYFGEGIVFLHDKLYQLTYKNQSGFIYDAKTFKQTGRFKYANTEGWSLTTDGSYLIMSDGTDKLTYLDPEKLLPVKTLAVTDTGLPMENLNELEFINGFIYANVFQKNSIVKINPATGNITGKIDLGSLMREARNLNPDADVLNGIAYDAAHDKIYVTGKLWPNIYEISFAH